MSERYLTLRGLAETAELRTATFEGNEHLVVPVIAMVGNSIVYPTGAEGAELVPSEVLKQAPMGWDGRPVVPEHPTDGNGSANRPAALEKNSFGRLFNTRFANGKLKTEAWIDVKKAEQIGGDAKRVLERVRNHEVVEVSIGAWVSGERRQAKNYGFVWMAVTPDHLAMLPEGAIGACSVELGCGAPRAAQHNQEVQMAHKPNLLERLIGKIRLSQEDSGMSDTDLREALWSALRSDVPAFDGVVDVFPDDGVVVYVTSADGELVWWSRTFDVSDGGEVSLNTDAQAVQPVTEYKPLEADCGCSGECECHESRSQRNNNQPPGDEPDDNKTEVRTNTMSAELKALVGEIITNDESPFTGDDEELLLSFSEAKLIGLRDKLNEKPYIQPEEDPKPMTQEEWLAAAPSEDDRKMWNRLRKEEAERRDLMVNSLEKAQKAYTKKQLEAKPTEDLEALCEVVKINAPKRDFTGRNLAASLEPLDSEEVPKPPNMARYIQAQADGKSKEESMRLARAS